MVKTKVVNGLHVPEEDKDCHPIVVSEVGDLNRVWPYIKNYDTVVQAGGNLGIWPKALSPKFKHVYTFEPDHTNFHCLNLNCTEPNIIKIQSALGKQRGLIGMVVDKFNVGANYVEGKGFIPTLKIDDLGLESCDLIYLDIEGKELDALIGAKKTIERFMPVIGLEDKDECCTRYGLKVGDTPQWLIDTFGYRVIDRYNRDILLAA